MFCTFCSIAIDDTIDGFDICSDCRTQRIQCPDCGDFINEGEANAGGYCLECLVTCESCRNSTNIGNVIICEMQRCQNYVCEDCLNHCRTCEVSICASCSYNCNCGQVMCERHSAYCDCGQYLCNNCNETHECTHRMPRYVRSYNYRPSLIFSPTEPNTYGYLGVELEYEAGSNDRIYSAVRGIREINRDLLYFKEDGSLNFGVEIVSMPMTWDFHKDFDWDSVMNVVNSSGLTAERSCGMHVHVSRRGFGEDNENRLMELMHKFEPQLIDISGREISRMDRWAQWNTRGMRTLNYDNLSEAKSNYSRYRAVNFCNRDTLEFRFFAGTADLEDFLTRMDLVDTMARLSTDNSDLPDSWGDFIQHLTRPESLVRVNRIVA